MAGAAAAEGGQQGAERKRQRWGMPADGTAGAAPAGDGNAGAAVGNCSLWRLLHGLSAAVSSCRQQLKGFAAGESNFHGQQRRLGCRPVTSAQVSLLHDVHHNVRAKHIATKPLTA